jgi:hypothetical protein
MEKGRGPIFLGGCPRSGLALGGAILDSHPAMSCGPDAGLIGLTLAARDFALTLGSLHKEHFNLPPERVSENFARAIGRILDARRKHNAKARAAEKSALNVLVFDDLARLFPDAQFIHCVRDGRDVAASLLERQWRDPKTGAVFAYCADAGAAARYWSGLATIGLEAETRLGARVFRLSYEKLAAEPKATLTALFDFLGVPWSDKALALHERNDFTGFDRETAEKFQKPVHADYVGRWKRDLDAAQLAQVEKIAGPVLRKLGYP